MALIESSGLMSGDEEAIICKAVSPRSGVTMDTEALCSRRKRAVNPSPVKNTIQLSMKFELCSYAQVSNQLSSGYFIILKSCNFKINRHNFFSNVNICRHCARYFELVTSNHLGLGVLGTW